jgi:predicted nucleic acid-binding protein
VALEHLGELHLVPKLLGPLLVIPPAVVGEFGRALPEWIEARPLQQTVSAQILNASLGRGESEALALALESKADLIILDDRAARRLATALRLPLVGTLGLLLRAKMIGLIPAVRPRLEALRSLPFHVSPRLYESVLRTAGEQ